MAATIETGFPYYSLLFKKVREGGGGGLFHGGACLMLLPRRKVLVLIRWRVPFRTTGC